MSKTFLLVSCTVIILAVLVVAELPIEHREVNPGCGGKRRWLIVDRPKKQCECRHGIRGHMFCTYWQPEENPRCGGKSTWVVVDEPGAYCVCRQGAKGIMYCSYAPSTMTTVQPIPTQPATQAQGPGHAAAAQPINMPVPVAPPAAIQGEPPATSVATVAPSQTILATNSTSITVG